MSFSDPYLRYNLCIFSHYTVLAGPSNHSGPVYVELNLEGMCTMGIKIIMLLIMIIIIIIIIFTITINFFTDDDCKGKLLDSTTLYT